MMPIFIPFFLGDEESKKFKVAKIPIEHKEKFLENLVKLFENDYAHVRVSNGRIKYRGKFSYPAFTIITLVLCGLAFIKLLPVIVYPISPLIGLVVGALIGWSPKKIDKILLIEGKKFLYVQFNITHGSAYMWAILDDTECKYQTPKERDS